MNTPFRVLSLALAASVALLSRASALTITHTQDFTLQSSSPTNSTLSSGTTWIVPEFDSSLGGLTAVELQATIVLWSYVSEWNASGQPLQWTPNVNTSTYLFAGNAVHGYDFPTTHRSGFATGSFLMAPYQTSSVSGSTTINYSHVLTGGTMQAFQPGADPRLGFGTTQFPASNWGSSQLTSNATLTVTYHYQVPDFGGGAALLLLGLGGLALARRWGVCVAGQ